MKKDTLDNFIVKQQQLAVDFITSPPFVVGGSGSPFFYAVTPETLNTLVELIIKNTQTPTQVRVMK